MPTLWCSDPRLGPDGLDHVVAVVVRRQAEQVEGAARAPRAPHLHADGGESQERGDDAPDDGRGVGEQRVARRGLALERVDQAVGGGRGVAGVLDDGGEGAVGQRLSRREPDGGGDGDPVAHPDVVEPGVEMLRRVERRRGSGVRRQHRERPPSGGAWSRSLRTGSRCPGRTLRMMRPPRLSTTPVPTLEPELSTSVRCSPGVAPMA